MVFKKIKERFFPFDTKTKKYSSDIFILSFLSFFLLSLFLLAIVTFFSYTSTKNAEEKNFSESIKRSQKLIFRLVKSYNSHIKSLYKNLDKNQLNRVLSELNKIEGNPLKKDLKSINKVAKEERVRISLIDYKTAKILWSSKMETIGKQKEKGFPEISYIYPALVSGEPYIRFTWLEKKNKLKVIVRQISKDGKYIWRILYKATRDKSLDNLIDFFKNTKEYEPLVEKTAMYSALKYERHGMASIELPEDIDLKVNKEGCHDLNDCVVWKKIAVSKRDYINNFISYVGIKFNNKALEEKLSTIIDNLYIMLAISLLCSLLLSLFLSNLFTRIVYRILKVIRKIDEDLDSSVNFPRFRIKELNELSSSFKKLLTRLQEKKKQARNMAKEILSAGDKERRDISRDLHDSVGQLLVAANFKIHGKEYEEAEKTISVASEELRAIYEELEPRSLEKMSLNSAVEWYLLKFFPKTFLYDINLDEAESFGASKKVQIYRIIQESIANVRKHAKNCTYMSITLEESSKGYFLQIKNDGAHDLAKPKKSYGRGLDNIALRAETFSGKLLVNQSGQDFTISVSFKNKEKK